MVSLDSTVATIASGCEVVKEGVSGVIREERGAAATTAKTYI
jgi:hypothetical protein